MKIILAGGNGFLGNVLIKKLRDKNEIVLLTRGASKTNNGIRYVHWDAQSVGDWVSELDGADVLINLVGRSVDCRYNEKNKKEILESRTKSTQVLGEAILQCAQAPKLWLNSASATIYRHSTDKAMTEESTEFGEGFSVDVCKAWEKSFFDFKLNATRQVAMRITIVLGKDGGAVKPLLRLAKFGLGGAQAGGKQMFSWIHQDDFAAVVKFIVENDAIVGPVNMAAPNPLTNAALMKTMRKTVGMPIGLPMPTFLLKFGALLIGTETELITKSRYVIPGKLQDAGFEFKYPSVDLALKEING